MGGDDPDAVRDIDPTMLVASSRKGGTTFWDIKPADPALMAVLSPAETSRTTSSRGTRGSRRSGLSRQSSRASVRSTSSRSSRGGTSRRRDRGDTLLKGATKTAARRTGASPTDEPASPKGTARSGSETPLDARSVTSRASRRSRRSTNSASDTAFDLQRRTREYVAKAGTEKIQLDAVKAEIRATKKRITKYTQSLGGVLALRVNDANVARQIDIMERRMVKSQNHYMDTIAHNNQLRTEVNIWRREIRFLKKANASIRADIRKTKDHNTTLEQNMKRMQQEHKAADDDAEAVRMTAEMDEETLRAKWEAMDVGPDGLVMDLPEPQDVAVDRSGGMAMDDEEKMRNKVHGAAWQMGTNTALLEATAAVRPDAKAVFAVVQQQTGVESPEEFADKYASVEAMNYALYRRVDQLISEGRDLKQQLVEAQRRKEDVAKVVQGEDEIRHNVLTGVDKARTAVAEQVEIQRNQYRNTVMAANAIRTSLNKMMDLLGYGDPDPELMEGSLAKYFGVFEQRLREVMLRYITEFYKPELAAAERGSRRGHHGRHGRTRQERLGIAQKVAAPGLTLAELNKTATSTRNAAPIVSPEAFAIGPSVPVGQTNKSLHAVSIPSVDGPKDSRQMAAFVRPWQTITPLHPGGSSALVGDGAADEYDYDVRSGRDGASESGKTTESLPNIEDMFGDRPVSVPIGKVRNRRASGAGGAVSPMDPRAATAPLGEARRTESKMSTTLPAL